MRRFTRLSQAGVVLSVAAPSERLEGTPIGIVGGSVLTRQAAFLQQEGPWRAEARMTLVDLNSSERSVLAVLPGQQMFGSSAAAEFHAVLPAPFSVAPAAATGNDLVFLTSGEEPEVLGFDPRGVHRLTLRVVDDREPLTPGAVEAFLEGHLLKVARDATALPVLRAIYEGMPWPEMAPSFDALLVDAAGWLWVRLHRPENVWRSLYRGLPSRWMVFNPDGRAVGTVELPPDLEVHQIGLDFLVGLWRDDLGVEYVRRHRLDRTSVDGP